MIRTADLPDGTQMEFAGEPIFRLLNDGENEVMRMVISAAPAMQQVELIEKIAYSPEQIYYTSAVCTDHPAYTFVGKLCMPKTDILIFLKKTQPTPAQIEEITVTGCSDCPMWGDYMVGDSCEHACYHPENVETWNQPFKSCPLKEKACMITLKA